MIDWYAILYEMVKLALQFGGALFIAWKAVQWALGRYKREKHWERKLQAYSDLLAAIGTMDKVLLQWHREASERREVTSDVEQETITRYRSAFQRLEDAVGVAELILPNEVSEILEKLQRDLRKAGNNDMSWESALDEEWTVLDQYRSKLLRIGKDDLKLQH